MPDKEYVHSSKGKDIHSDGGTSNAKKVSSQQGTYGEKVISTTRYKRGCLLHLAFSTKLDVGTGRGRNSSGHVDPSNADLLYKASSGRD